jgi:hypothetical protein
MNNLIKLYDKLQSLDGINWYNEASDFCRKVSNKYNIDLAKVTAIKSALSPGCNYETNKKDLIALIEINKGIRRKGYKFSTYGQNVIKAQKIFEGILLPENAFNVKTGAKTYNFFYNMLLPSSAEYVTIDRHAFRIATGLEYGQITPKQYREIAEHYTTSANKIGILPNQLQSVLWVNFRNENNIKPEIYCPF